MTAPELPPLPDWPAIRPRAKASSPDKLAEADGVADEVGTWPDRLWSILAEADAPRWSLPTEAGGLACDRPGLVRRYGKAAEGSLTAAFILTQHDAAVRRLVGAGDRGRARHWVGEIAAGRAFATVGISQLTTSRRHGAQALRAVEAPGGGLPPRRGHALGDGRDPRRPVRHRRGARRRPPAPPRPACEPGGRVRPTARSRWPPCRRHAPARSPARGSRSSPTTCSPARRST